MRQILAFALLVVLAVPAELAAQWTDLGQGLAGTSGIPVLEGIGPLLPTAGTKISVAGALPSTNGWLVVGFGALQAPFKGGTLVPTPNVVLPIPIDAAGAWQIIFSWPIEIPFGFQMWWQAWITDGGGPQGFAAGNALLSVAS